MAHCDCLFAPYKYSHLLTHYPTRSGPDRAIGQLCLSVSVCPGDNFQTK